MANAGDAVGVLQEARALVSAPERCARSWYAMGVNGERMDVQDPLAVCWCPIGAMLKVAGLGDEDEYLIAVPIVCLAQELVDRDIDGVEDAIGVIMRWVERKERKHVDILRAFDGAVNWLLGEDEEDEDEENEAA